ncbi:hypothetical protein BJ170DRAFT_737471 [Xylariales sp. AK1849]|nr:hypothetical protein BJ170DRAFT_737471 [Xylariales sp. AK1849]
MKTSFTTIVSFLAATHTARAGSILLPEDAEDGLYEHTQTSDGEWSHELLGNLSTITARGYVGEGTPVVNCLNQYTLSDSDMMQSETGLITWFGTGRKFTDKKMSYKYGTVVSFVCNYGSSVTITGAFLQSMYSSISTQCGLVSPGYVTIQNWQASYGVDQSSKSFC